MLGGDAGRSACNRWQNWKSMWGPVYGGLWMPSLKNIQREANFEAEGIKLAKLF